ncbi:hypothetical protein ABTA70_20445, partial [Acinetobacter baumannii]
MRTTKPCRLNAKLAEPRANRSFDRSRYTNTNGKSKTPAFAITKTKLLRAIDRYTHLARDGRIK